MNITVLLRQVPDLVEELAVDADGKQLDATWLKYILNEYDDHALEQAILLKEKHGGQVNVLALDIGEVGESLFNAVAKGADSATKICGEFERGVNSHTAANLFLEKIKTIPFDLILTGVQAIDELDGQVGAILAANLNLPFVGVVRGVEIEEGKGIAKIKKEYPGGVLSELSVQLPAVLGIQAAAQPPRYVPVAKLRQAMKSAAIQEAESTGSLLAPSAFDPDVIQMYKPESTDHAEMIEGTVDDMVEKINSILLEHGLMR